MNRLPQQLVPELDSFGLLALGALSYAETLTALLAVPGDASRPTRPSPSLLFAALGAVSLCRTLQRRLRAACPAHAAEDSTPEPPDLREILR